MRKLILIFCLLPTIVIDAKVIDWGNFNEETMSEVMFSKMNEYTKTECIYSLIRSTVGQGKIYRCIRKYNEKMMLDDLDTKIYNNVLRKMDSRAISKTNLICNIGLLDCILCADIKTYEDLARKCISDWANSVEGVIFMKWSRLVGITSYYNQKSHTVYISLVCLN